MTADDSCHKFFCEIFIYPLKLIPVSNFSSLGWFLFSSTVISWQQKNLTGIFLYALKFYFYQLLTAVDSWWQLLRKNIKWNFHVHSKVDIYSKFQHSRMILFFIKFYQLSSAFNSCWQLITVYMKKKLYWNFVCTH